MTDKRTALQKALWSRVGPPLYYSSECMLEVKVNSPDDIKRPCGDCNCEIIAPRKAIAVGRGGASLGTKAKVAVMQAAAAITGRCV